MYYIKSFGGLTIPVTRGLGAAQTMGNSAAINAYIMTSNGWYDMNRGATPRSAVDQIVANFEINADTADDMYDTYELIRGYLHNEDDIEVEFFNGNIYKKYCRFDSLTPPVFIGDNFNIAMTANFSTIEKYWRSGSLVAATGNLPSGAGLHSQTFSGGNFTVPGNADIYDVNVLFDAPSSGSISSITVENLITGYWFFVNYTFTNSFGLQLQCGPKYLNLIGASGVTYSDLSFKDKNVWFNMRAGTNQVRVSYVGGGTGSGLNISYTPRYK